MVLQHSRDPLAGITSASAIHASSQHQPPESKDVSSYTIVALNILVIKC